MTEVTLEFYALATVLVQSDDEASAKVEACEVFKRQAASAAPPVFNLVNCEAINTRRTD